MFPVTRKALANVAKHACALEVQVALSFDADGLALDIGCDGRDSHSSLESTGGSFEVRCAPGAGTVLRAKVPPESIRARPPGDRGLLVNA